MNVNNAFYDQLGERWYTATDDPIALLRAECRARLPWILKTLEPQREILDIGCGAGFLSNELARNGHFVTGIDLSADSLRVAASYDTTKNVQYRTMDALHLEFGDGSFDAVCAMDFLEHISDRKQFLLEVARILKPGGLFFFHTFNRNPLASLIVIKGVEWFVKNTPPQMHVSHLFMKPKELREITKQVGLEIRELRGLSPRFLSRAFWNMIITGNVPETFEFTFTNSTLISYSGVAKRRANNQNENCNC